MGKSKNNPSPNNTTRVVLLIVLAIITNIAVGQIVSSVLHWPLYLDSIGTILVGALLGPLAGAATGAASAILWGLLLNNPEAFPYAITAAFIGWAAGFAAARRAFDNVLTVMLAGILTGAGAALISAPITATLFGGVTGAGTDYFTAHLQSTGANLLQAVTVQGFISDPLDKVISFLIAWLLWLPLHTFFKPLSKKGTRPLESLSGYSVAVLSSLVALLVSWVFYPAFGRSIFTVFFIAVLISALRGGLGPALLTIAVGALANILVLKAPNIQSDIMIQDWMGTGAFLLVSLFFAYVVNQLEKTRQTLEKSLAAERESEARVRAVTDSVDEALILMSPEGRILHVNHRFQDIFGIPGGSVLQQQVQDLETMFDQVFEESGELFKMILNSLGDTEHDLKEIIVQNWPKPGELQLYSTPVQDDHGFLGRLFVFRDVTHEREVDRMKTEFVSLVSHELRTPLTSIKGFTEMVLDGDAGEINEEVAEFLGIVKSNADRLVALVNDLLDISRIESGRIQLKSEQVDLREVVKLVVATMQHLIEEKDQNLVVELDDAAVQVMGDQNKMVQILTNYVSNAYKYTPSGGDIRLVVKAEGDFAHVAVIDNGYGIAPEDQEKLFTRFYRVDNSMTREIGGTGLGLSIVKAIVEMQGGRIGVESTLGEGSTFYFTVPLVPKSGAEIPVREGMPAAAQEPRIEPAQLGTAIPGVSLADGAQQILVVEDDPDIALLISQYLEHAGFRVRKAFSAEEALESLNEDIPAMITLDINLPGMDGYQLADRLSENPETKDIPILVVSVYHDDRHGLQFDAYALAKPIDHEKLVSSVTEIIEDSSRKQVLIIEDDPDIRQLLITTLNKQGFEAQAEPDGESGLTKAKEIQPGVILLDLRMPGMDGFAVLEALKEDPTTDRIPVITMTGSQELKTKARARVLAMGAADHITKPFDLDNLIEEVRIFLNTKEV
jgi:PAS domain S-box-containing protein